jgi:hypothetical protein
VRAGRAFVGRAIVFHCGFEAANTFSDSFAEFRKLLRAEHEEQFRRSPADAWVEKVL